MADRNTMMTSLTQGKFIHSHDRQRIEAQARALRAEAVHEIAQAAAATVRSWFAPRPATRHADHARARTT